MFQETLVNKESEGKTREVIPLSVESQKFLSRCLKTNSFITAIGEDPSESLLEGEREKITDLSEKFELQESYQDGRVIAFSEASGEEGGNFAIVESSPVKSDCQFEIIKNYGVLGIETLDLENYKPITSLESVIDSCKLSSFSSHQDGPFINIKKGYDIGKMRSAFGLGSDVFMEKDPYRRVKGESFSSTLRESSLFSKFLPKPLLFDIDNHFAQHLKDLDYHKIALVITRNQFGDLLILGVGRLNREVASMLGRRDKPFASSFIFMFERNEETDNFAKVIANKNISNFTKRVMFSEIFNSMNPDYKRNHKDPFLDIPEVDMEIVNRLEQPWIKYNTENVIRNEDQIDGKIMFNLDSLYKSILIANQIQEKGLDKKIEINTNYFQNVEMIPHSVMKQIISAMKKGSIEGPRNRNLSMGVQFGSNSERFKDLMEESKIRFTERTFNESSARFIYFLDSVANPRFGYYPRDGQIDKSSGRGTMMDEDFLYVNPFRPLILELDNCNLGKYKNLLIEDFRGIIFRIKGNTVLPDGEFRENLPRIEYIKSDKENDFKIINKNIKHILENSCGGEWDSLAIDKKSVMEEFEKMIHILEEKKLINVSELKNLDPFELMLAEELDNAIKEDLTLTKEEKEYFTDLLIKVENKEYFSNLLIKVGDIGKLVFLVEYKLRNLFEEYLAAQEKSRLLFLDKGISSKCKFRLDPRRYIRRILVVQDINDGKRILKENKDTKLKVFYQENETAEMVEIIREDQ